MVEEWRDIPGYEGLYQVSDNGDVRPTLLVARSESVTLHVNRTGYVRASLSRRGQKRRALFVHRLVLFAFVGPCPPGQEGAHLNGIRHDNRLFNLKWATKKENMTHRDMHGKTVRGNRCLYALNPELVRGENNWIAKLRDQDIITIRRRSDAGESRASLAREFGVGEPEIKRIALRLAWKHVPDTSECEYGPRPPVRGSRHGMAKLNEDQVMEIKREIALGHPRREIALRFGCLVSTVGNIATGRQWSHVVGAEQWADEVLNSQAVEVGV